MSVSQVQYVPLSSKAGTHLTEANILCLGNFDGVHLGHQALLSAARSMQAEYLPHARCGVLCFSPPSSDFLLKDSPKHLSTDQEKAERFAAAGMDFVLFADFLKMRELTPTDFINEILIKQCHCVGIVCGFNYRFGKGGAGSAQLLQSIKDLPVFIQPEITCDGETVSSSRIRKLIREGNVEEAARLLTIPYSLTSPVLHGKALGRRWGAPTINQRFPLQAQIPRLGVYVTESEVDGVRYRGISNVGIRPTVESTEEVVCETFLFDFSGDLYEKNVKTSFLHFLRPEQKFESADMLQAQIASDIAKAKKFTQEH